MSGTARAAIVDVRYQRIVGEYVSSLLSDSMPQRTKSDAKHTFELSDRPATIPRYMSRTMIPRTLTIWVVDGVVLSAHIAGPVLKKDGTASKSDMEGGWSISARELNDERDDADRIPDWLRRDIVTICAVYGWAVRER